MSVFQVKLGLVGVILGVSKKEMGVGEKLRVRQQTGWLKKLCDPCCPLDGLQGSDPALTQLEAGMG